MTQFGRKTSKARTGVTSETDRLTAHQERIYGEFFKAIEQVGRRLERTEEERDRLANRVSNLEAHAERDDLTGNYFLPVRMDQNNDSQHPPMPKSVMAASFASVLVALAALGVVLTQEPTLSKEQIAALQFNPPQYANLEPQNPNWQKIDLSNDAPVERSISQQQAEKLSDEDTVASALNEQTRPSDNELSEIVQEPDPLIQSILASLDDAPVDEADTVETTQTNIASDNIDIAIQKSIVPEGQDEVVLNIPIEDIVPASGVSKTDSELMIEAENEATPAEQEVALVDVKEIEQEPVVNKAELKSAPVEKAVVAKTTIKPEPVKVEKATVVLDIDPDTSLPESVKVLERRAMQGVSEAQHDLATLYAAGNGATLNYDRAIYWFTQAADAGIANAHYNLGVMAHQGLGQEADMKTALSWYQNAAELGHPEALYNLGIAYTEGIGTSQDIERGASYFKRAAEVGVTQAAYNLGILYESSFLGGIDKPEAAKYYKMAAEGGHQDAAASYARVTGETLDINAEDLQAIAPASGADVDLIESIQSVLITEKYLPGNADGVLGVQTVDAIKSYERANGLPVTGSASRELLSYMRAK